MDTPDTWMLVRVAGRPTTYAEWLAEMQRWLPRYAKSSPAQKAAERLLCLQVAIRFPPAN